MCNTTAKQTEHENANMTHYTQYVRYHVDLLKKFKAANATQSPFNGEDIGDQLSESDEEFINTYTQLCDATHYNESLYEQGQWMIGRIISTYSHLTPELPRDLLWFFGGDCLHYMPDEEIAFYQQLDELRFTAEEADKPFDYPAAKDSLLKAH